MMIEFPRSGTICSPPSLKGESSRKVNFSWTETNIDLDNVDISDILISDTGVINSEKDVKIEYMLEQVKKNLLASERKTSKWQNTAITHSLNTD